MNGFVCVCAPISSIFIFGIWLERTAARSSRNLDGHFSCSSPAGMLSCYRGPGPPLLHLRKREKKINNRFFVVIRPFLGRTRWWDWTRRRRFWNSFHQTSTWLSPTGLSSHHDAFKSISSAKRQPNYIFNFNHERARSNQFFFFLLWIVDW